MRSKLKKAFRNIFSWWENWGAIVACFFMVVCVIFICVRSAILLVDYSDLQDDYIDLREDYTDLQDESIIELNKEYEKESEFYSKLFVECDDAYIMERRKGDGDYYYNTLSEEGKALYKAIYKAVQKFWNGEREPLYHLGTYYLAALSEDDYRGTLVEGAILIQPALRFDNPSFFFETGINIQVESLSSYSINYNDIRSDTDYYFVVTVSEEYIKLINEKDSLESTINKSVLELSQTINEDDTDFVKYVKIYEYIINHTKYMYDYRSKAIHDEYTISIIGVLDGEEYTGSICEGYAAAMTYLCNYFGVECIYVSSLKIRHAFNLVRIDGIWYYSDTTNGDWSYTNSTYFLGGEKEYWLRFDLEESYLMDMWRFEMPTVSQEDYFIDKDTYTGGLKFY